MSVIPAGLILLLSLDNLLARISVAVFVVSLVLVFGTSATYHRIDWSPAADYDEAYFGVDAILTF